MSCRLIAFLSLAVLSGCSSMPDSIELAENAPLVTYQQASAQPQQNVEKAARWGGVIARVENLPDATMLEMVHYPLRSYGRPVLSDQSVGRFRVYVDGFLDPIVFEKGRAVTFAGKLTGVEEGSVGKHQYLFPTLQSEGYHLWQDIDRVDVSTFHYWPHSTIWGWTHGPHYQRVIIRNRQTQPSGGNRTPTTSRPATNPTGGSSSKTTSGTTGGTKKQH